MLAMWACLLLLCGAADLQCVTKSSLVLQADGCDDGELQGAWGEHVGRIPGTSKPCLHNSHVHLQEPMPVCRF